MSKYEKLANDLMSAADPLDDDGEFGELVDSCHAYAELLRREYLNEAGYVHALMLLSQATEEAANQQEAAK